MCEIKLLVIGNSLRRNHAAVRHVTEESMEWTDNVKVTVHEIGPFSSDDITPDEFDLAVVDESVINKGCSRSVLGSGVPVLAFGETTGGRKMPGETTSTLSKVVKDVVGRGMLRDYIVKVTEDIDETHRMIASSF